VARPHHAGRHCRLAATRLRLRLEHRQVAPQVAVNVK
jgi:hypothetical protein